MAYIAAPDGAGQKEAGQNVADEESVREFLLDLAGRKEFRSLAGTSSQAAPSSLAAHPYGFGMAGGPPAPATPSLEGLRLHGAQVFVANFSNPNTPYSRLLINWQTGTGKTIAAISVAQEYVRQYRSRITILPSDRPSVFVIGFTKTIIQSEMLRHPEFGFVSPEEVAEVQRLRALAGASGAAASPESRHYSGYVGVLKRRITDRSRGGYYQFYGYKEFANRLFLVTRQGTARGFTVAGLYARRSGVADAAAPNDASDDASDGASDASGTASDTSEPTFLDRIDGAVEAGDVEVNRELLDSLRGGLIVADEIHNTYNIQSKNNYGVAIQYALDKIAFDDASAAPRAVFMSATVTGGVATEVVDLLNFLVPAAQLPEKRRLRRAEFFRTTESADGRKKAVLLPGALERIGRLTAGRVSFLLDTDETSYPKRIFVGDPIADPLRPGKDIAYLRFTPCPMSSFHEKTLAHMLGEQETTDRAAIPTNAYTLYDMVYPNPEFEPHAANEPESAPGYGLYLSAETPAKLASAPVDWKTAAGVTVESLKGGTAIRAGVPSLISGPFLDLAPNKKAPPGLGAYSTKYEALGRDVLEILRGGPGKIMIYHHRVRMSGVLQIQEVLEMNGFVDETSAPSPATVCAVCGIAKKNHSAPAAKKSWAGAHEYTPARYVMVNSEIERSALDRSIARYNSQTNVEGFELRVLIGSKIIREGFDLKAVRHQLIASLPTDIPTLIQVFGRAVRKNSHAGLPESQRDVRIKIYVSTANHRAVSPEVLRYAEKMETYFLTQEVEKAIRRYAVDAFINYERMKEKDPALIETANIDAIPYRPAITRDEVLRQPVTTTTFEAYGFGDREVEIVKAVITALFEVQPVWTYPDLWAAVQAGEVQNVAQDPGSFGEESFALALSSLGYHSPFITRESDNAGAAAGVAAAAAGVAADSVSLVSRVGDFYVRSPKGPGGQPVLDVESYVRDNIATAPVRIRVADYVQVARKSSNFVVRLAEFEDEFEAAESRIEDALIRYDADFHFTLLRAIVEGYSADVEADSIAGQTYRKATTPTSTIARVVDLYTRFKILVLGGDIAASPEAKRLIRSARAPRAGNQTPVGYVDETAVRLYGDDLRSGSPDKWYDIPRKVLGIGNRYNENDIVVGYVELRGSNLRFKIRPPIQELESAVVRDIRSLSRGAVCETRPRAEQENLVLRLSARPGGKPARTKSDLRPFSSADLCLAVRQRLLAQEEISRRRKTGMLNGPRWFYLFNENLPTITLGR